MKEIERNNFWSWLRSIRTNKQNGYIGCEDCDRITDKVEQYVIKCRIEEIQKCFPFDNENNNERISELKKELQRGKDEEGLLQRM